MGLDWIGSDRIGSDQIDNAFVWGKGERENKTKTKKKSCCRIDIAIATGRPQVDTHLTKKGKGENNDRTAFLNACES